MTNDMQYNYNDLPFHITTIRWHYHQCRVQSLGTQHSSRSQGENRLGTLRASDRLMRQFGTFKIDVEI